MLESAGHIGTPWLSKSYRRLCSRRFSYETALTSAATSLRP